MVLFRIDTNHHLPIYKQLVRQVRDEIIGGRLQAGDKLPSHREVARDLVINHLTVKRAYETLEREGLIETRRGRGTFVCRGSDQELASTRKEALEEQIGELLQEASNLGYGLEDFHKMARRCWANRPGERQGR